MYVKNPRNLTQQDGRKYMHIQPIKDIIEQTKEVLQPNSTEETASHVNSMPRD